MVYTPDPMLLGQPKNPVYAAKTETPQELYLHQEPHKHILTLIGQADGI